MIHVLLLMTLNTYGVLGTTINALEIGVKLQNNTASLQKCS